MRPAREIMGDLASSGLSPSQTALMMELMAAVAIDARPSVDMQAERRRAKDRERKRGNPHIPQKSAEVVETPIPPNDIYSNPPENPDGAKAPHPPFSEKVVLVWNDGPAQRGATKANPLDAGRRKALSLRVRENSEAAVLEAIANLAASEFHCGKNERGWRVNIGWMLKSPENFAKALEMGGGNSNIPAAAPVDRAAYLAKLEEKPWLRGTNTPEPPWPNGSHRGPRTFAQLAGGIASSAAH